MFEIGEYIMYGKSGVCKLDCVCRSPFDEKDTRTYYKLEPIFGTPSVIYTPVDNDKVAWRSLMKKEEAMELIERMPNIDALTVENEKQRRETYKSAVSELKPEGFVSIIKTVYDRRRTFETMRRHITEVDSEYESFSKRALYAELSIVLGVPFDDVESYIAKKIDEMPKAE